nr:hypothetical protein [uncultured bacterium]
MGAGRGRGEGHEKQPCGDLLGSALNATYPTAGSCSSWVSAPVLRSNRR